MQYELDISVAAGAAAVNFLWCCSFVVHRTGCLHNVVIVVAPTKKNNHLTSKKPESRERERGSI